MIRTIVISNCISVQGLFVRAMANGQIAVRDGQRIFVGFPVTSGWKSA
jgi:hypothetical protein